MYKLLLILIFLLFLNKGVQTSAKCIKGNCKNGKGTFIWGDGNKYIGEWKNSKPDGKGKLISPYGVIYEGDWQDNHLHGKGTIIYHNGNKYIGNFKNGKRHGQGILYHKNGKIIKKGQWKDDTYIGK